MNQVIVQILYNDEIYSELKSEENVADADVPKVAAYLADKLAIRASETAGHAKRRAARRRARETRRNKSNLATLEEQQAQAANE